MKEITEEQAKYLDWCIYNARGWKTSLDKIKELPEKWRLWANAHFYTIQTGWDAFHTCADTLEELLNEFLRDHDERIKMNSESLSESRNANKGCP